MLDVSRRDLRMRTTEIVRLLPFVVLLMLTPAQAQATDPECSGVEGWFTSMAHVHLKNAGLITNDAIDFTKTKTVRLASDKIAKCTMSPSPRSPAQPFRQSQSVTPPRKSVR
jgi:hypothetical protein